MGLFCVVYCSVRLQTLDGILCCCRGGITGFFHHIASRLVVPWRVDQPRVNRSGHFPNTVDCTWCPGACEGCAHNNLYKRTKPLVKFLTGSSVWVWLVSLEPIIGLALLHPDPASQTDESDSCSPWPPSQTGGSDSCPPGSAALSESDSPPPAQTASGYQTAYETV